MADPAQSNSDRSKEVLKEALTLISRHGSNYTPISYAVWYEVANGASPDLKKDVQSALQDGRLSDDLTYDLYQKHFMDASEKAVMASKARLAELMNDMQGSVSQTSATAGTFQTSLTAFGEGIAKSESAEEIRRQVDDMLDGVRTLDQSMSSLNAALDASQAEIKRLTEELKKTKEESEIDALTSLANRRTFDSALRKLVKAAHDNRTPLFLLMLDIDHFKSINDRFGHPFGDRVIQGVAKAIQTIVPGRALGARYGGEEFAVLLPETAPGDAKRVAEEIRTMVAASRIRQAKADDALGGVTISIGAALLRADESTDSFVERADKALYASKKGGRNRVTLAGAETAESAPA